MSLDLSSLTAEQVYEGLKPEQLYGLALLLNAKSLYGPWTKDESGHLWTRHGLPGFNRRDVFVWQNDDGGTWEFPSWVLNKSGLVIARTHPDAESAMIAADAALRAAGAVLCGEVVEPSTRKGG